MIRFVITFPDEETTMEETGIREVRKEKSVTRDKRKWLSVNGIKNDQNNPLSREQYERIHHPVRLLITLAKE